ncbi:MULTISPECIES: nitric oxide reductase transcriptional regulator NorR [Vibrio]|uniref:Nitric oxide reductase transcriptional regulator NorR n=1 Tax=Vibrio algicola TaxID=2662262 RepID=A0A5Q0TH85_9VIBR|nr:MULTISPECIES: nitric oxide reductase transcriptional regulator NorR [Vibrio]MBD1576465.1 nitric oxide reductase transcriptional regulator NorR [Vibrio sp. S11_S32]
MVKNTSKHSVERVLLQIALNLNARTPTSQHYQKLIDALQQVLPCDASALFILDHQQHLVPVAMYGLSNEVLGRTFLPELHPRLKTILASRKPVRFAANSDLPDPFDGLLSDDPHHKIDVHACMGCSLYVEDTLVGALTLDAQAIGAFKSVDDFTVETFATLAAGIVRNISLFEALNKANHQQQSINKVLIDEARNRGGKLVGISPQIKKLLANIKMVAKSNYAVLISGETGTGKELVAHRVHAQSLRYDKPMVYVNCAALPESIAESELFGHVKGAFTGANSHRAGKFELADGGTIFLDEIGELPLLLQAKLLRVIQQGEVQRVGADKNNLIDVRIIAATNRDLNKEVSEGRFRSDLFHRLNVFPIQVAPLRDREGDIPVLIGHVLDTIRTQFQLKTLHIHPQALQQLERQSWLGNVRELEHTLMRAGLRAMQEQGNQIELHHFTSDLILESNAVKASQAENSQASALLPLESTPMRSAVEAYQKQLIEHALQQSGGVWAKAAEFLQMDRGNLYKMGKKLGL